MTSQKLKEKIPLKLLTIFLLLAAGIIMGGMLLNSRLSRKAQLDAENDLSAIADLKVQQIVLWRTDRILEADIFALSPFFTRAASKLISDPGDRRLKKQIYDRLMVQQKSDYWHDLALLDKKGRVVVETGAMPNAVGSESLELLEKAKKQNKPCMTDFYFCNSCQKVHLDIIVPLFALERETNTKDDFIGYVVLRLDPHVFLYPLVQSWPVPSKSSETLLIKRNGQDILFLNDLRFRKNTALKYRIPQSQAYLPTAAAAAGSSGVFKGVDYRGVKVLSQLRSIPGTNWYLVTKIDQDEVFADLKRQGILLILVMTVTVFLAGALVLALFLAQRRGYYKQQYRLELDKLALVQHYDYLTRYANDIIFLLDQDRRIVEINERGLQAYGYAREKLIGMEADRLRSDEQKAVFGKQMDDLVVKGGMIYQTVHKRKDGSTFPVEVSARTIEIEGKKYLQAIVRDISERKQYELDILERNEELVAAEEELRHTNEVLESNYAELEAANQQLTASEAEIKQAADRWSLTFDAISDGIVLLDAGQNILQCNQAFAEYLGKPFSEILGKKCYSLVHSDGRPAEGCPFALMLKSKQRERMEMRVNGRCFEVLVDPILDEDGEITGAVHILTEITEKKKVQAKLQEQLTELQRWQNTMLDREDRVMELKKEINELLAKLGRPKRYG